MITNKNRAPVVAGRFYPADKNELTNELNQFYETANNDGNQNLRAIISPHAGYVFSGQTAAYSYSQIPVGTTYNRIFIIASSHYARFNGASIYHIGNYKTPLGEVEVDKSLAKQLIEENDIFIFNEEAHTNEHSIEVQLPFLQHRLKSSFKIIPIVIGTGNSDDCKKIALALKTYFKSDNLFVISTDFSHYPEYNDAVISDSETVNSIISNNSETFLSIIDQHKKSGIPQLQTSICGWTSVLTLLYLTEDAPNIAYNKIHYTNSGENILYGDKTGVVGYWAVSVTEMKDSDFAISKEEKKSLIKLARTTLENFFIGTKNIAGLPDTIADLRTGAFVSLHIDEKLRGCIGRLHSNTPLKNLIPDLALSAALNDSRFSPLKEEELKDVNIEISLLSPLEKINSLDEFELGKHGIFIRQGFMNGTLLPQVATTTGWSKKEFVEYCSKHKAGIGEDGWKQAELYRYQAIVFHEEKTS